MKRYNVYCDESCHLEKDSSPVMILGAMYCPEESKKQIYDEIRAIKIKHKEFGEKIKKPVIAMRKPDSPSKRVR